MKDIPVELSRAVLERVEAERDRIVSFAQEIIRTVSVNPDLDPESPGEAAVARIFKKHLLELGFDVEEECVEEGRPNLISTLSGTGDGPRLLFNAHMDTVRPYEEPEWLDPETGELLTEWSVDPFGGVIKDGYLYGRGSCDHKTEIVEMLEAVRILQELGVELDGDLVFVNDCGEETGSTKGLLHMAQNIQFDVDAVVYACTSDITELGQQYFSGMRGVNVFTAVSGRQIYRMRVYGHTYHTLTPKTGWTAAENVARILPELQDLMEQTNRKLNVNFGTGKPWMRLEHMTAPEHSRARKPYIDLIVNRTISPNENPEEVWLEFKEWAENRVSGRDHMRVEVQRDMNWTPYATPGDHPIIKSTVDAVRTVRGLTPNVAPMPTPTGIARLLINQPHPMVLFGFGSVNFHHAIDERIPVQDVVDTVKVYALLMLQYLGYSQKGR